MMEKDMGFKCLRNSYQELRKYINAGAGGFIVNEIIIEIRGMLSILYWMDMITEEQFFALRQSAALKKIF